MRAWCISDGSLWLMQGDAPAVQVESPFANDAQARAERDRQRQGWKHAPRDDYSGVIPANMLWGGSRQSATLIAPKFRHVVRGKDADSLFYLVELSASTGLFHYRISDGKELRLFHQAQFRCLGLAYDADRDGFIISCSNRDGTANLAVYDREGTFKGAITGGDAIDSAPSCSSRQPGVVFFQSAGIGRHPQSGHAMALAPSTINRLNYKTGQLDTLLEDRGYDFLAPREDEHGNLYYIRRPYERSGREQATSALKDALLMPWRLLKAIFGWLNFYSWVYGKEPLRSAGGPKGHPLERDVASLWLHGRMIELGNARADEKGSLVPASWQLRRRSADGSDSFVADHVVSYDVCEDGSVFYSNGYELFQLFTGKPVSRKHGGIIESVSAG
jgi:hypothetical protein